MSERFPFNSEEQREVFAEEISTVYQEGDHAFRFFNRRLEDDRRPVVVNLEIGATALDSMGMGRLWRYAQDISRPLITIDPPGYGTSVKKPGQNIEDLSYEYVDRIRQIGIEEIDAVGTSYGAVIAGEMALAAEGDVKRLVTVSHPVTHRSSWSYLPALPGEAANILRDMRRIQRLQAVGALQDAGPSSLVKPWFLATNVRLARLALRGHLSRLEDLPTEVRWTDIIGERDRISSVAEHEKVTTAREANAPNMTELHVVLDHGHTWAPWDRDLHNKLVRDALEGGAAEDDTVQ